MFFQSFTGQNVLDICKLKIKGDYNSKGYMSLLARPIMIEADFFSYPTTVRGT